MHRNGWYPRHAILPDGRSVDFGVHRFRCASCRRTVSYLPDFCVPYKHFCADVIASVLEAVVIVGLSLRAVAAADGVWNAAAFSAGGAGRWVVHFLANCHNLRCFGLPRLGVDGGGTPPASPSALLARLFAYGAGCVADGRHRLRVVQRGLGGAPPPYGFFRAQLLPGCVA